MKARSVVAGVVAAGAMVVGGAASAAANIVWCLDDPPTQVQTSSGTNLTVNTTIIAPKDESALTSQVVITATTAPDGAGGTLIKVDVALPAGMTTVNVLAQVKRYHVSAMGSGTGGTDVILYLDVPTS
jgi:hypothetical protein